MKKIRIALIFSALLTLTACSGGEPLPVYGDAFQHLMEGSADTVPADAPVTAKPPLVVIFSDNVETWFQYAAAGQKAMQAYGPLTNNSAVSDIEPRFVANSVMTTLKARFPTLQVAQDFNEAVAKGARSVCVVDFRVIPGQRSFQTTSVDVTAYFFDEQMRPVSRLSGHGEGTVPYPAWDVRLRPSTEAALQELDRKMGALVR